ncbi:hypothetical protein QFZ74_005901 [Streptomyces sp. V3I7]|nr:hypothetical protein [Streptomyces sp. V3I7]
MAIFSHLIPANRNDHRRDWSSRNDDFSGHRRGHGRHGGHSGHGHGGHGHGGHGGHGHGGGHGGHGY